MANNMIYTRKTNPFVKYIFLTILVVAISAIVFIFFSPIFEQNKPKIEIKNEIYWNLKTKLKIKISDDTGLKYYKISFISGEKQVNLASEVLQGDKKELILDVPKPSYGMFATKQDTFLYIEVVDNSKWNYLNGNKTIKKVRLHIDTKKPTANIINNTRYIRKGGSALVVTQVKDKNLMTAYISFNKKIKFRLVPFHKDGYFVSLIAWDINIKDFKRVNLVAIDKAGNKTVSKVPLFIQSLKVKKDNIKISEKFIQNISVDVLEKSQVQVPQDLDKIFIKQNETIRKQNVNKIRQIGLNQMDNKMIDKFYIKRFKRLKGSRTFAQYAEKRSYYFENKKIDEAWHLGMDWASVKRASIFASNSGKVVFKDYLGIYGNTIIIDHKMGLMSLYAHTSSQNVEVGDDIKAGQKIAHTGSTGAVMGDHLHFGILIQGIEVNPLEWMDKNWIKINILNILKEARKDIDSSK
jgi:hypothetical protein